AAAGRLRRRPTSLADAPRSRAVYAPIGVAHATHRTTLGAQPAQPLRTDRVLFTLRRGRRPGILAGAFISGHYRLLTHRGDCPQATIRSRSALGLWAGRPGCGADDLRV